MIWTLFKKKSPIQVQENRLLALWSQRRSLDNLSSLPFQLVLQNQLRKLEAIRLHELASSNSLSTRHKVRRNVARLMRSARDFVVNKPLEWLSRRRCLQPVRVFLVNSRRRATMFLLVGAVRLVRSALRSRGRRS